MNRNLLKKLHWYGGLALFLTFLFTGMYMHFYQNHLQGMDDSIRMQYRSIHIYILLSSLLHIIIGAFVRFSMFGLFRAIQLFGSFLLFLGVVLICIGFFTEVPVVDELERSLTRYGLYSTLGGTIFLIFPQFIKKNRNIG